MFRSLVAALAILSLGACDTPPQEEPLALPTDGVGSSTPVVPENAPDQSLETSGSDGAGANDNGCGTEKLSRWLNLLPTEPVKAEIAAAVGERPIRYYTQGAGISADFRPERLNVELGVDGRIKLFRCG